MKPKEPNPLTPAKLEVLQLLSQGYTYKEIAVSLKKGRPTVAKQLGQLRERFNCKSNSQLILYIVEKGWLSMV